MPTLTDLSANQSAPYAILAASFAKAIAFGDFETAHSYLSSSIRNEMPQDQLCLIYGELISYWGGPATHVEVMATMDEWPARQPLDLGWAYVEIHGQGYCEAVAVVVDQESGMPVIREIEWGRP